MKKIAFILPTAAHVSHVGALLNKYKSEVVFAQGTRKAGIMKAAELIEKGVDIIISRGETARMIREEFRDLIVITIPVTGIDLAMALDECRKYGQTVAVVSFSSMVERIEQLAAPLSVKILKYDLPGNPSKETVGKVLDKAAAAGAEVILGGNITPGFMAKERGIPCVVIPTSDETYIETFHHARGFLNTLKQERTRAGFIKGILGYAYEGIVSIDGDGEISLINRVAERILKCGQSGARKVHVDDVCPELHLPAVLTHGHEELDRIIDVRGGRILCNKAPIMAGKKIIGAVAAFQEIDRIENMESRIRRETYAKGHVARYTFDMIKAVDKKTKELVQLARRIAESDSSVVILGETGTGKEVFAQSIHQESRRGGGPFVAVNCAALPESLLESELFGYVEGAFTGAKKDGKRGLFEIAHKGTLFLDEIAEMDISLQSRLLRVLQERAIMRLGSDRVVPVDVRIMSATHNDLEKLVAEGTFRQDLFYRLNILTLTLPPLRERRRDIAPYALAFVGECAEAAGRDVALSPGALGFLERLEWPGNIRELRNMMERVVALSRKERVSVGQLKSLMPRRAVSQVRRAPTLEEQALRLALAGSGGNVNRAADALGISRLTLWRRMSKYAIDKKEWRGNGDATEE